MPARRRGRKKKPSPAATHFMASREAREDPRTRGGAGKGKGPTLNGANPSPRSLYDENGNPIDQIAHGANI